MCETKQLCQIIETTEYIEIGNTTNETTESCEPGEANYLLTRFIVNTTYKNESIYVETMLDYETQK